MSWSGTDLVTMNSSDPRGGAADSDMIMSCCKECDFLLIVEELNIKQQISVATHTSLLSIPINTWWAQRPEKAVWVHCPETELREMLVWISHPFSHSSVENEDGKSKHFLGFLLQTLTHLTNAQIISNNITNTGQRSQRDCSVWRVHGAYWWRHAG